MGRELLRQFPFIDAVISGPGEMVITPLIEGILNGRGVSNLRGVLTQQHTATGGMVDNAPQPAHMDDLPVPEFDDYFAQLKLARIDLPAPPRVLFETSRGCWWGQKHHCTFCGLNGQSMAHRSKSAARALSELEEMAQRYPGLPISVVDNILDMQYFRDFLPALAERNLALRSQGNTPTVDLFYEVKANLNKPQLRLLREAGITQIQPGIESFSDSVLRLMRKGVRAIQNIQLLKWCKELGILPLWNILWGFPGEPPDDYGQMAELAPLLTHLPPPSSASPIRLDRFSPNFEAPAEHGFQNVRPYPSYYYVYSLPDEAVRNLAYFFAYDRTDQDDAGAYTTTFARRIADWQDCYSQTDFFSVEAGHWLLLWDFRPVAVRPLITLSGLARWLYLECDQVRTIAQLQALAPPQLQDAGDVKNLLDAMYKLGLMLQDRDCYLSLAIPTGSYTPNAAVLSRLEKALLAVGRHDNPVGMTSLDCHDYALTPM
jgi:ribosomal peptide maturation radical SAM protein 1